MSSGGLVGGIGRFVNGVFFVNSVTLGVAILQDLDGEELRREGAMLAERDDVAQLRNERSVGSALARSSGPGARCSRGRRPDASS